MKRKDASAPRIGIGCRIGKLTVAEQTAERKSRYTVWLCRCDCGGEIRMDTRTLQRGTVTDCGCMNSVKPGTNDLTGRTFGHLTALRPTEKRYGNGAVVWLCRCSLCGKEIEVSVSQLVMGYTKSCGNHDKTMVDEGLVDGTSIRKLEYYMTQRFPLTKSGYTGVWQEKKSGKWVAEMQFQGKKILNRRFARKEEAIAARKKAEEEVASYLETFYLAHPEWNRAYYQTRSRKLRQTTMEKPFRAQKARQDHGKAERQDDASEAQRTEQGRP